MKYDEIRKWADEYRTNATGIDYHAYREDVNKRKANRYYQTHIATDKVSVWCEYCGTTHEALRLTHDKNIAPQRPLHLRAGGRAHRGEQAEEKEGQPL